MTADPASRPGAPAPAGPAPRDRAIRLVGTYLPITRWARAYAGGDLRPDLLAGLTGWAVGVPVALGYGALAGVPPEVGLITAATGLTAYALFATSRHLKVTASSTMAVMSFAVVSPLAAGDPARFLALTAGLALITGALLVAAGVLRLGFVSEFLSKPVVAGFVIGLAITVILGQLPKLLGVPSSGGSVFDQLVGLVGSVTATNLWALALGGGTIAIIMGLRRVDRRIPGALITVVAGIVLVGVLDLTTKGVAIVGAVASVAPDPGLPPIRLGDITVLVVGAAGIVFLAAGESIAAARSMALRHRYEIDADQELVGLGAANLASGLFGGFVADGSLSQSATGEEAGARTQLSSLVTAALVLVTAMFLVWMFANLPMAVLGGIIISSVVGMIDTRELRRYWSWRRTDAILAIVALLGVLSTSVLGGLILAVLLSIALLLYRASRPYLAVLGRLPQGQRAMYVDVSRHEGAAEIPGLLLLRLDAPLYFFNASVARSQILDIVDRRDPRPRVVIIDIAATGDLDVSTADTLDQLLTDLADRSVALGLAFAKGQVRDRMRRTGLMERVGEGRVALSMAAAVRAELGGAAPPAPVDEPSEGPATEPPRATGDADDQPGTTA